MGLSNALSGGIVMAVMVAVLLTLPLILDSTLSVQEAKIENSKIENEISKTQISISALTATNGDDLIEFTITNDAPEKLWNFEKFNLIVTYDQDTSRFTESLTYDGMCGGAEPNAGFWCIESFSGDNLDPRILNEDESFAVDSKVANNAQNGAVIVLFSTNNGVTTSNSITIP